MLRREAAVKAVLIDHWPMLRLGVARVLQSVDVRVVGEAATRVEGNQLVRSQRAELVVIGDHLGGDLAEVADMVRDVKAVSSTPWVIVLVGQLARDDAIALLQAGADGLLARSVGPEELGDAVGRVLLGERVVSPGLLPMVIGAMAAGAEGGDAVSTEAAGGDAVLTAKEREVLAWLAEGHSNQQIADGLFITPATVKTHLAHIYAKLGVKGRHQALARAVALGYLR